MKKILLALLLGIMCISSYGGGGIIVTQGDCCSGGTGGSEIQRNIRALNMLTIIDDTTVIDGGIADRNTIKNLDTFTYRITNTSIGERRFGIRDSIGGSTYDGFVYGGKKILYNAIIDFNDTIIALAGVGEQNSTILFVDTTTLLLNMSDNNLTKSLSLKDNTNPEELVLSVSKYSSDGQTNLNIGENAFAINHWHPAATGNFDPYFRTEQNSSGILLEYDAVNNPIIPGENAVFRVYFDGAESRIRSTTQGGQYDLNTAGTHTFTSVLPTTASFNGDIEATAFNIISDKKLKENIKEAKSVGLLDVPVYTYNYNGVIEKDTVYYYDTIGYKSISKDIEQTDVFGNKSKKTITYKEPITNKVIKDVVETKISQPTQYGLMAQDIAKIAPEAVTDNGDYQSVDYAQIVALLIMEVKALKNEIEILKQK